jgi:ADP-ribose pyrophosphatase YjhB (NUDIX family)
MAKDLKLTVDGALLNIRCGVILRHEEKVIIEVSNEGRNSVLPGGRVRINERSSSALVREIKEETGLEIAEEKLRFITTMENFFSYDGVDVHEIYFLYEYTLKEQELFYFDGKEMARSCAPISKVEQFILLSTEIKGYRSDEPKTEWTEEELNDRFICDYVRVFDEVDDE